MLAAGIDLDVLGIVSKTDRSLVRLYSQGYGLIQVDISDLTIFGHEKNTTAALIRGIYHKIHEYGYSLSGMDVFCTSNVLSGSGLSSSAAFEVFLGTALNELYCNSELADIDIAKIGQYAENVYFGKPSGLMDQMASSVGSVVAIDFQDFENPQIEKIDFSVANMGHSICIINSGADHADLTDEYAKITEEMAQVSAVFGKKYMREFSKQDLLGAAALVCKEVGDRAFLRALHFQNENERAKLEAIALQEKNYTQFLKLVTESGFSSYMYLQNIYAAGETKNQRVAVALSLCQEFLQGEGAFRVHGGGFAGTVQAFVPMQHLEEFQARIESVLGAGSCHNLSVRQVGGVKIY